MPQYFKNGSLYASEDHFVYGSNDSGDTWQTVCRLEPPDRSLKSKIKDTVLRTSLVRSLRRNIGISHVVVVKSGTVIALYDAIYRYTGSGGLAKRVFDLKGIKGPLSGGLVVDERSDRIYFGEYNNDRPYAVRIIRGMNDGKDWEVCYQFPEGAIKHVHSIVPDPYRKRLWICTGDSDQESGLYYTDDDFKSVHLFNGGSQVWRMISLFPLEDCLVWGSDAGQDSPSYADNYIYKYRFGDKAPVKLAYIQKPAYYSMRLANGLFALGTTYEAASRDGMQESADLWISKDGLEWKKKFSFPFKPSGRKNRTRYATLNFPKGEGCEQIFITPENTEKYDFQLIRCQV
ncbi:hypothetical protein [Desulfonatronum thioautotrophicum]|uniref:hypothetical protein n=1 Tax=Desulfonatronum thioautotrophicum TaxID=617001 RepID=UPI0012946693|nr:hypothetical protein [Desulfonatronum thioautotrophicum]